MSNAVTKSEPADELEADVDDAIALAGFAMPCANSSSDSDRCSLR